MWSRCIITFTHRKKWLCRKCVLSKIQHRTEPKRLLLIYEHMAFVIFVSLHYLHILHSFTFPHFCQLPELHFCCISKYLSILCSFVSSRNTLVKLLAFLFRNTSTLYLFVALISCLPRGNTATIAPNLKFTVPIWKKKFSSILCCCTVFASMIIDLTI